MAGADRTAAAGVRPAGGGVGRADAPGPEIARARRSELEIELLDLLDRVSDEPWEFDFFALLRRVEALALGSRDAPGLGLSRKTAEDPVRLCQEASLGFAPRTIAASRTRAGVTRLWVYFLGLMGPQGPLPLHLTEFVRSRERQHNDPTAARFLDIFHHRMLSLFYRAWAQSRAEVSLDRWFLGGKERYSGQVASLIGLGMPSLRGRGSVPDWAKLAYAGRLAGVTRNAEGLAAIVEDYFEVPVRVTEFVGRWESLPRENRMRLGGSRSSGELGVSTMVGTRVWNCQGAVRLTLGPMGLDMYTRLLPTGPSYPRLADWVKLYAGAEQGWEAALVLKEADVPALKLGSGVRLGWTTWLSRGRLGHDASDVVLRAGLSEDGADR